MATAQADPEKMTLDRSDGSATMELYRAALGPVHVDYYLRTFTGFDAAGKAGRSWNWAAALLTLNWMAFRRLWGAALAYTGALVATLLFLFGILPLIVALPHAGLWALLALALALAVAVPGAYGNAWLYSACNKAMDSAYSASATQQDACALLQQRAAGRTRIGGLAAVNLGLSAALLALVLAWPGANTLPLKSSRMERARLEAAGTLAPASPGAMPASAASVATTAAPAAPAAPAAAAPATVAASVASVASVASAAAPATPPSRSSQGLVQNLTPPPAPASAVTAAAPAENTRASATQSASLAKAEAARAADEKKAAADKAELASVLAAQKAAKADKAEQLARAADAARAAKAAKAAAATASAPEASTGTGTGTGTEKYLVNVGLFADANNARNAYTRLTDAGLPAQTQELNGAKGVRTRVRAGPFETRAEAEAAADKIRALKLEAQVVRP